ncbi:MAG TPA: PTS system mannose/fructose/sorbose family transporter subunit IID [Gemmatimonadales bacterium]|nr:PTS system mannose/fructose/sorbose family transporter subunit IID [Gemmatimonadales bacterium]
MALSPRWQALIRLYGVQAAWTYERMAGIGVGHAAAPLLRDLFRDRPSEERRQAVARSTEYFNCHPYLAGIAVGAVVRAEEQGVPGAAITRLRTALSGPLGAIGDQLIWTGEVPIVMGVALALLPMIGWWAVFAAVVVHNLLRFCLTLWGLDLGLAHGLGVGRALELSWLPPAARRAQRGAAFAVGLALPIVSVWLWRDGAPSGGLAVLALAIVGTVLVLSPLTRTRVTGLRVGLVLLAVALLVIGGSQ